MTVFKNSEDNKMKFNYGYEKKKFDEEWVRLRKEYEAAGMSKDAIDAMYRYDLDTFREQRNYCRHTQLMDGFDTEAEKCAASDDISPMQKRLLEQMCVDMPVADPDRRYAWIDELDDEDMVKAVKSLSRKDVDLLTRVVYEGFRQIDVAQDRGISKQTVNERWLVIREKLKKVSKTT